MHYTRFNWEEELEYALIYSSKEIQALLRAFCWEFSGSKEVFTHSKDTFS